jgi:hypothetical protein
MKTTQATPIATAKLIPIFETRQELIEWDINITNEMADRYKGDEALYLHWLGEIERISEAQAKLLQ